MISFKIIKKKYIKWLFIQKTSLAAFLNAFKDGANFTAVGRLFQSFVAEKVK